MIAVPLFEYLPPAPGSRRDTLRSGLRLTGTRSRPKRKTHRRWWIGASVISIGFATLHRPNGLSTRAEFFEHLGHAASARRMAFAYSRTAPIKTKGSKP